ncbi:hypothetical protein H0H93_001296 [Arthromyces matolae]|nr:hypothetical protein H0H93_001296 [Arthromyces matolae]
MIYQYTCYARDLDNRPFTEEDKQRVDMATGSLTQIPSLRAIGPVTTNNGPLVYTHLLPRDSSEELATFSFGILVEHALGNFERRHQLEHYVPPEMRALFDQGLWIITPEKRILDIYLQNPRATINEPFYNYTLMTASPVPDPNPMREMSLTLHESPNDNTCMPHPSTSAAFVHPFDTVPQLSSHVHPRFVICYVGHLCGNFLRHQFGYTMRGNVPHRPIIHAIMEIFYSWTQDIPSRSRFFSTMLTPSTDSRPDNDSDSQRSLRTVSRRLHPKQFKRAQTKYQDRLKSRGQKRGARLDKKALCALDESELPTTSKKDFLRNWILSTAEEALPPSEHPTLPDDVEHVVLDSKMGGDDPGPSHKWPYSSPQPRCMKTNTIDPERSSDEHEEVDNLELYHGDVDVDASDGTLTTPPNSVAVPIQIGDTPGVRVRRETKRDAAKRRVDSATAGLSERRCIVHNTEHDYGVQYAHILARCSGDNLEPYYEYRVVPSKEMHRFPLFRLNTVIPADPLQKMDLTVLAKIFSYPYIRFPTLRLHVKPQYLICNIGQRLLAKGPLRPARYIDDTGPANIELEVLLDDILEIYKEWITMPDASEDEPSDANDDGDNDDDSDDGTGTVYTNVTKNQRLGKRARENSFNSNKQDDENPRPLRRSRRGTSKRDALDGQTLLDHEEGPDSHKLKLAYVQEWVSKVAVEKFSAEECIYKPGSRLVLFLLFVPSLYRHLLPHLPRAPVMIYQYTCYARDLDNRPFTEEDKRRVDMATGSLTQVPSLRAIVKNCFLVWNTPGACLGNFERRHELKHHVPPEMRALFDQGLWIITPEKRILDIYLQNPRATINEPFYNYTLMTASPVPDPNPMREMSLTLHESPNDNTCMPHPFTSAYFVHPFDTVPQLSSHVHPRFVICYLGHLFRSFLRHKFSYTMRDNVPRRPIVHAVMEIFFSWIQDIPSRSRFFSTMLTPSTDGRPDNDSDSQRSLRTVSRRLHPKQFKRAQTKYQDRLRSRGQKHGARLNKKALCALDESELPTTSKKDFLQNWILSTAEEAEHPTLPDDDKEEV